jgi:hypothetical protein
MNCVALFLVFMAAMPAALVQAGEAASNPLSSAIALLDSLAAKVTAEGETAAKEYQEFEAWCEGQSKNLKFQIKNGVAETGQLQATITKAAADIAALDDKIESLASSISTDEQELKEAADVRAKEAADFAASEAGLVDAISSLDRAVMILQKEMQKNPAAFAQVDTSNERKLLQTLGAIIDGASLPAADQKKIMALAQAQSKQGDSSDDGESAAPAYKTSSTSVLDMLEDLKDKAEGQLADLRKAEATTKHNYQLLEQSSKGQTAADTKDLNDEKKSKAAAQEGKAVAEGDYAEALKTLGSDKSALNTASTTCTTAQEDHESTTKSRNAELTALTTAKKILSETSSGAVSQTYSFLEVDHESQSLTRLKSRADLANAEIVNLLKKLAKENHSAALAQLASRIAATLRYGKTGAQDPFTKVKQLITDLLAKLQAEAQADATEKSYCDTEMAKTDAKKAELDAEMAQLSTEIDQVTAASAQLKNEVTELSASLAKLAKSQADMDAMRTESHQQYLQAKGDLELGLRGVRKAIGLLKEYYGGSGAASASLLELSASTKQPASPTHDKAQGAGEGIIASLEVVDADFARDLALEQTAEDDAEAEYQKISTQNKDAKDIKQRDVQYKTKELKSMAKATSELSGDKSTTGSMYEAVLEYLGKLKERCIGKAESYETIKSRREAELQGLKEALSILRGESAFVQRKKRGLHSAFLSAV